MTSNLDLIRGRQVVASLTNQSGGAIIAGDVVIVSAANDESFTTTTSAAYNSTRVGVAQESIAAAAAGRILLEGYAPLVNVSASATRGHYLLTHTVAKQATSQAGYAAGAFGQIIKAGTTPSAMIFPVAQVGSAGSVATDAIWDAAGDLAVGTGADTASKLTKGADGTVLQMASGAVGWQYPALTYATAALTGDVTLTTAGTFYDGPSVSLAAGTWLITGIAHLVDGSPYTATVAELYDGTNHLAVASEHSGTDYGSIALSTIAVFGSPVTVKIRATSVHNGGVLYASNQQGGVSGTNNATRISAVRIA